MKRIALLVLAALAVAVPAVVVAADVAYNDPAMSFTAPAGFVPVPLPSHDPARFDEPAAVAAFVKNAGKDDAAQITIRIQNFDADASSFESTVENDLRTQSQSDVFISKSQTTLPNGMPAFWMKVTVGSGFDQMKVFEYVWTDTVRGVQLSVTGRYGLDDSTAKKLLANVSAVAYPRFRY